MNNEIKRARRREAHIDLEKNDLAGGRFYGEVNSRGPVYSVNRSSYMDNVSRSYNEDVHNSSTSHKRSYSFISDLEDAALGVATSGALTAGTIVKEGAKFGLKQGLKEARRAV